MELMVLSIALIAVFVGIFLTKKSSSKIIAFSTAAIVLIYGYLSITHETSGYFYKGGEIRPGQIAITEVGHCPVSIVFKIKMVWEDRVIAESLELSKRITSAERKINGKLFKIGLLSLDKDGFTIHLTNETGYGIVVVWIAKYNKLSDFFKRRAIFKQ